MGFIDRLKEDSRPRDSREEMASLVKESTDESALEEAFAKNYSTDKRQQMGKDGRALPDGSFPINDCGDVSDAIPLVGRYKGSYDAKAHVVKRAKALGCSLPDGW